MNVRRLIPMFLAMALGVLALGAVPALAVEGYALKGSFGGTGSGDGQFEEPIGVAVNDSTEPLAEGAGDVYVVDEGNARVERFSSEGKYEMQFNGAATPAKSLSAPKWIALDNSGRSSLEDPSVGDVYVADTGHHVIDKFSAGGVYEGQLTGVCPAPGPCAASEVIPFGSLLGVAVDPSGNLWVSDGSGEGYFDEFDDTGVFVKSVKDPVYQNGNRLEPGGLAVDSADNIYPTLSEGAVFSFNSVGEVLAIYNNKSEAGVTALAISPPTGNLVFAARGRLEVYAPHNSELDSTPPLTVTEGLGESGGVAVNAAGTAYLTQRAQHNIEIFKIGPMPPAVVGESSSHVGSTEARVSARVNPEGEFTTYHVEYGTSEQYVSSTPEVSVGAGTEPEPAAVFAQLSGLQPGVEYHFRFVASNVNGNTVGLDTTFTTPASAGASASTLPDGRVYELVSTASGPGEVYAPTTPNYLPEDIYTEQPFQAAPSGEAVIYMADPAVTGGNGNIGGGEGNDWLALHTSEGWQTSDITPVGSHHDEYEGFSSDLTTGIVEDGQQPPLAPNTPAECQELYSRDNTSGAYRPVLTATMVPGACGKPHFAGASADESHVILQDEAALTERAQTAEGPENSHSNTGSEVGETCEFSCNLYDVAGDQLQLVNVLPGGEADPNATFGGPSNAGRNGPDLSNAISSDGSRIFWTDTKPGPDMEHIYVLENGASNVPVSGEGAAKYWTATPDGRYAFYTEAGRLWRFDTASDTRQPLVDEGLKGEVAGVQGVLGINDTGEDGAYVYFVATGIIADNESGAGARPELGEDNLYLRRGGTTTFIATLSPEDNELRGSSATNNQLYGDWVPNLGNRTAEVTPDGLHLVFESVRPLTGYDNIGAVGGERAPEVFAYAADTGRLACASCSPVGEAPQIEVGGARWTLLPVSSSDTHMPRWISEDGSRVFFTTVQPLVSRDTNGVQDVYEWEREGAPSCPAGASARRNGGCAFLISDGESSDYSYLVDTSAGGNDVFFTTRAQLVLQDRDEKVDLYDARVDGYRPVSPPLCTGTGCQGVPPALPIFATPASVTFNGVGDFEPRSSTSQRRRSTPAKCGRGKVHRGGKCVKKRSARKAKRSSRHSKKGRKR